MTLSICLTHFQSHFCYIYSILNTKNIIKTTTAILFKKSIFGIISNPEDIVLRNSTELNESYWNSGFRGTKIFIRKYVTRELVKTRRNKSDKGCPKESITFKY